MRFSPPAAASLVVTCLVLGGCSAGGEPQPTDCRTLVTCLALCSTTACEDQCRARASAAAIQQAEAIERCDLTQECQGDDACLEMNCGPQLLACAGPRDGGLPDTGTFPNRYVGSLSALIDTSGFGRQESTGLATFVRDDLADPVGQTGLFAFYRLESVTYTATASGNISTCTQQASFTETFTRPPAAANLVRVRRQATSNGYEYDVTTTLTRPHPNGLPITCPGSVPSTTTFNAELNVAAGTPLPVTPSPGSLVGSASGGPGRTWSWNLQGAD